VNGAGRVVRTILTPGQADDAPRAPALLAGPRPRHVVADTAYDSDAIRALIRRMRARACIEPNPTRKRKKRCDKARYKRRNVIERFFGKLKRGFRRVATRYEKKAENYLGFAWLAAVLVSIG
jgi:putative transposase